MREPQQNYYGSLCTEMYELLHKKAPEDELNFYLSYADYQSYPSSHTNAVTG